MMLLFFVAVAVAVVVDVVVDVVEVQVVSQERIIYIMNGFTQI